MKEILSLQSEKSEKDLNNQTLSLDSAQHSAIKQYESDNEHSNLRFKNPVFKYKHQKTLGNDHNR